MPCGAQADAARMLGSSAGRSRERAYWIMTTRRDRRNAEERVSARMKEIVMSNNDATIARLIRDLGKLAERKNRALRYGGSVDRAAGSASTSNNRYYKTHV